MEWARVLEALLFAATEPMEPARLASILREGPEGGIGAVRRTEELVAQTREQVGPDVEVMVDAWISLNVEHAVRLGEALCP